MEVARVWLTNLTHHKALTAMRRVTHNFRQLGHTVITSESVNFHRLKNNNFRQFDVMDDEEMAMELLSR